MINDTTILHSLYILVCSAAIDGDHSPDSCLYPRLTLPRSCSFINYRSLTKLDVTNSGKDQGDNCLALQLQRHLNTGSAIFEPATDERPLEWQIPRKICSNKGTLDTSSTEEHRAPSSASTSTYGSCYTIIYRNVVCSYGPVQIPQPSTSSVKRFLPPSGMSPAL